GVSVLSQGAALNWYTQLPPESIDSFGTLVRKFTAQYATSRPHHVTSAALASLRQNDDEPLRAFMERFIATSIKIRNLNPEVALHAMLMALKPGPFVDSLCRESPRDMNELRARAQHAADLQNMRAKHDTDLAAMRATNEAERANPRSTPSTPLRSSSSYG
ncbi:uncharacterized protein LOC109793926, partial [Cajanus cajan]|uniref:uncharacterized protein LOC109793926 n=1 Tax=Cajanus cajan TaxID=3821 RepID=UPI00098DA153